MSKYITVEAEVCVDDIIDGLSDADLAAHGLRKITTPPDTLRETLYNAAQAGDRAAMIRAAEALAWEVDGKILVTQMAA